MAPATPSLTFATPSMAPETPPAGVWKPIDGLRQPHERAPFLPGLRRGDGRAQEPEHWTSVLGMQLVSTLQDDASGLEQCIRHGNQGLEQHFSQATDFSGHRESRLCPLLFCYVRSEQAQGRTAEGVSAACA